jgi:bifunctional non-homologous end joining protein LigD
LWLDDTATTDQPYNARRRLLAQLELAAAAWMTVPSFTDTVAAVMDACTTLGLEGMVAKRADSLYRPGGRSADWLKLKTVEWKTVHAPKRIDARR